MALAKNITFLANGYSLAEALKSFSPSADSDEIDATVLANDFRTYEQGFKSGSLSASGVFDSDTVEADKIHDILSAAFRDGSDVIVLASYGQVATGATAIMLRAIETKYSVDIPLGQLILSNAEMRAEDGLQFGVFLLHEQIDEGTVNGSSVDNGAATTNGGVFQVHLQNDDATDVDVKLQHSSNNSTWVDLATVNDLSDPHTAGIAVVAPGTTVNRYTRAVAVITGGDTVMVSAGFARRY